MNPTNTSKLWVTLGGFDDPSKGADVHSTGTLPGAGFTTLRLKPPHG